MENTEKKTITTTLKCGIVMHDARYLNCGLRFDGNIGKHMFLSWSTRKAAYIYFVQRSISLTEIEAYKKEFEIYSEALIEANEILKQNEK